MNIQRYTIKNLLSYQVEQVKRILNQDTMTIIANDKAPHFNDIYVGLNTTEIEILEQLGYSLSKYVPIGEG